MPHSLTKEISYIFEPRNCDKHLTWHKDSTYWNKQLIQHILLPFHVLVCVLYEAILILCFVFLTMTKDKIKLERNVTGNKMEKVHEALPHIQQRETFSYLSSE